jgi:putative transposase
MPGTLYSKDDLEKKLNYIHKNPVAARFVDHEEDYPYSSAVDYSGQKGLVEIVKLY